MDSTRLQENVEEQKETYIFPPKKRVNHLLRALSEIMSTFRKKPETSSGVIKIALYVSSGNFWFFCWNKPRFLTCSDLEQNCFGLVAKCFWQRCKNSPLCVRMDNLEKNAKTFFEKKNFVVFFRYRAKYFQPFNKKNSAGSSKRHSRCLKSQLVGKKEKTFSPKEGVIHNFRTLNEII